MDSLSQCCAVSVCVGKAQGTVLKVTVMRHLIQWLETARCTEHYFCCTFGQNLCLNGLDDKKSIASFDPHQVLISSAVVLQDAL